MVVNLSGRGDKDLDSVARASRGQVVKFLDDRQKRTGWLLVVGRRRSIWSGS